MSEDLTDIELDTHRITEWRSIITLVVFVIANLIVLFPFHVPIPLPRFLCKAILNALRNLRIIPPTDRGAPPGHDASEKGGQRKTSGPFVFFNFPVNFVTGPLVADLFLLIIQAIGRQEVYDGTIGTDNIHPYDILLFFFSLAYIAISIDASGLVRFLAFKVLQWGGKVGHKLFFYLYTFFFALGSFIGNDPIILSGTAFLAYMTRVSSNIVHPRAWIHTQFAIANIASAILVSSNPTNLVLAGAFGIRFIDYTAYMIVPVVITAIILFPFLLYIVFADEKLIPISITMHELPPEAREREPVNPNIPHARLGTGQDEVQTEGDERDLLPLEEILHPYLDKKGASVGALVMAATLIAVLAFNASQVATDAKPVCYVTLPAAVLMFTWDVTMGWIHREETRRISRKGRRKVEEREREDRERAVELEDLDAVASGDPALPHSHTREARVDRASESNSVTDQSTGLAVVNINNEKGPAVNETVTRRTGSSNSAADDLGILTPEDNGGILSQRAHTTGSVVEPTIDGDGLLTSEGSFSTANEKAVPGEIELCSPQQRLTGKTLVDDNTGPSQMIPKEYSDVEKNTPRPPVHRLVQEKATLVSLSADGYKWLQETFPTVAAVLAHLPFALVPFSFEMFILVQALVTKGWVPVFAYGWNHWVRKTGTVGSIGGMGFLSVILCNFAGTNIGTTILLCRVIQAWQKIHELNGTAPGHRTFWSTVYSMALGVNYGAFSVAFSASLAGLLWRDILSRKHINVPRLEFARVNLPIIAIAMTVGCVVLIGEMYIVFKNDDPL
ncbi:hypothetical protein F4780DRAFT_4774 [Xylariomycetidae sp. FL0641]|nr:hypothetical protein F4780DRAFT_4774 [Xylariomycetidae sp. FL0641]